VIDVATTTHVRAGLLALAREEIEQAISAFEAAVVERPDDADRVAFLAVALFAGRRHIESQVALDRALDLSPGGYWPNLKAGEIRLRLGDPVASESHFLVALRVATHGSRESAEAAALLARARATRTNSISHHAILPRWLTRRPREPAGDAGSAAAREAAGN
jgi:tetratricopeptide (TPR) repeat protein